MKWKFSNWSHGIQRWSKLCEMTWFNMFSTFMHIKNYLDFFGLYFCFWIHMYITFVFTNTFQSLKFWNEIIHYNILFKLYSNIICKNIVKIFQKFEMGNIQTHTFLKKNTNWHPEGHHCSVLSLVNVNAHLEQVKMESLE